MELLPHDEFSSLHIRQFLAPEAYEEVLDEVEHSLLGFCRCKSYYTTSDWDLEFLYPDNPPTLLAGVSTETGGALPTGTTQQVLTALRLPFTWGASAPDIHALLGSPYYVTPRNPDRPTVFDVHRFRCGIQWPYEVGCCIWPDRGCQRLWVVRADYFHDDD
jgi:hypothetical protein